MNTIKLIRKMGKGFNAVPDRWLDYTPVGREILGWRIRCCKVPLRKEILVKLDEKEWFGPEDLMDKVPNVGCIVDLTATHRYYDGSIFRSRGIKHVKILCAGHVLPAEKDVRSFFQTLDEFLGDVQSDGKVIMVHCTHGVNRTGYLVTRYLVERKGMAPQKAIEAFNDARGHPMERQNYIDGILAINQPKRSGSALSCGASQSTSGWKSETGAQSTSDHRSHRSERSQDDRDWRQRQQRVPVDGRGGYQRRRDDGPVFARRIEPDRSFQRRDRNDDDRRDYHTGRSRRSEDRTAYHSHDGRSGRNDGARNRTDYHDRPARNEGSRDQPDYRERPYGGRNRSDFNERSERGYRREDSGRSNSYNVPPWRR